MEFSFHNQQTSNQSTNNSSNSNSNSSLGSDRLRKAIERNRAKQQKRASGPRASAVGDIPTSSTVVSDNWSAPTRKSVVSAGDEVEFTTAIRKAPRRAPAKIDYGSSKKAITKSSSRKSKNLKGTSDLMMKGIWVFCAFLILRLVLSEGGVIDFYQRQAQMENKIHEHKSIMADNENLLEEIEKIKTSEKYQKTLVRDHLGYIANDEYLILFPEDS